MKTRTLALAVIALCLGCSVVKQTRTRSDWAAVDAKAVKRLAVITSPLPDGNQKVGELWSRIARRYVNQKRDFLAKEETAAPSVDSPKSLCKEGIEGVLWLNPTVTRKGSGVEQSVKAQLLRCSDGQEDWYTEAAGSWESKDPVIDQIVKEYEEDFGPEVEPYVAPAFHLLKATLDTLPNPVLNEQDTDEKIQLD